MVHCCVKKKRCMCATFFIIFTTHENNEKISGESQRKTIKFCVCEIFLGFRKVFVEETMRRKT